MTLSAAASENASATCTASFESGDTASAADLMTLTGTSLIAAGSTSALCGFRPVSDSIDEEDETFTVTLSNPSSNVQLAADPTAKGTIRDDDDPPTVSVGDVSAEEGTALTFTVALSAASGKTVTVDWAASAESGDTATAGTDFTAVAATTLTFDAGQEEKTVTVQTTDDSADENDETFTVTLSSPSNATIPDATAKGTIEDDDGGMMPVTPPAQSLVSNIGQGDTDSHTGTIRTFAEIHHRFERNRVDVHPDRRRRRLRRNPRFHGASVRGRQQRSSHVDLYGPHASGHLRGGNDVLHRSGECHAR